MTNCASVFRANVCHHEGGGRKFLQIAGTYIPTKLHGFTIQKTVPLAHTLM
jgi:hypothetical protein